MDPDCLIAREDVVRPKRDPEPYQLVAARLGILPLELVAIEDSGSGMTSARSAGIPILAGAHGEPGQHIPGVHVICGLSELASNASLENPLLKEDRKIPNSSDD